MRPVIGEKTPRQSAVQRMSAKRDPVDAGRTKSERNQPLQLTRKEWPLTGPVIFRSRFFAIDITTSGHCGHVTSSASFCMHENLFCSVAAKRGNGKQMQVLVGATNE
jgi:hypothetical protein